MDTKTRGFIISAAGPDVGHGAALSDLAASLGRGLKHNWGPGGIPSLT